MKGRYRIKTHESGNGDGNVSAGTLVVHLGGSAPIQAGSIQVAEEDVRKQIEEGVLSRGRVYEICPAQGMTESVLSLAVALDGKVSYCDLAPAAGLYSGFRRICPKDQNLQSASALAALEPAS